MRQRSFDYQGFTFYLEGECWRCASKKLNKDGRITRHFLGKVMQLGAFFKYIKHNFAVGREIGHHTCFNKWCCNPDHIELLRTKAEHLQRHGKKVSGVTVKCYKNKRAYNKEYRNLHTEAVNETNRERYTKNINNPESYLVYNKEKRIKKSVDWNKAHPDKVKATKSRPEYKEAQKIYNREWQRLHPRK